MIQLPHFLHPVITSWQVWRVFQAPPTDHPMYTRMMGDISTESSTQRTLSTWGLMGIGVSLACSALGIVASLTGRTNTMDYFGGALVVLLIIAITVPFSGVSPGTLWTLRITSELARIRKSHLYDLLATTPDGGVKAAWAAALGIVLRSRTFENLYDNQPISLTRRSLLFTALTVVVMVYIDGVFLTVGVIVAMLYLDHFHSTIVAVLASIAVGMTVPTEQDARTIGLACFLVMQLFVYGLTVALVVMGASALGTGLWWGYGVPHLLVFYLSRELIIAGLWHYLGVHGLVMTAEHEEQAALP